MCALEVALATLKRGCAYFVRKGNNLIFVDSIYQITGPEPELGDQLVVCDPARKMIGWGIFNPRSVYRVRMLQSLQECQEDLESVFNLSRLFRSRLESAVKLRLALGLPASSTNAYRLINSDGDNLSGVVVDRFGDVAVVHSGVCWLELNREMVVETLKSVLRIDTVVWRLRPVISDQEGIPNAKEGIYTSRSDRTMESQIQIVESDVQYTMSLSGQKTGFYSDQRDNRLFLRSITRGKRVLDLCCYTGGFALNAALGGAIEVLGIDSSQPAIDLARLNAERNNLQHICQFSGSDILQRLQVEIENGSVWDVVILDPPKLVFSTSNFKRSLNRYRKLNRAALRVVKPGGILLTCSCSGAVNFSTFVTAVWDAALQIGKRLTVLRQSGAAADHVFNLNHPEGNYLKCLVVRVE